MTRYTLRVFGIPVVSLDTQRFEYVQEDESGATHIEGGSAHNFERDGDPLSPTSHHEWEWEDKNRKVGFHA